LFVRNNGSCRTLAREVQLLMVAGVNVIDVHFVTVLSVVAEDGQNIFLCGRNIAQLVTEHGGLRSAPAEVSGQLQQLQQLQVTEV